MKKTVSKTGSYVAPEIEVIEVVTSPIMETSGGTITPPVQGEDD